MPTRNQQSKSKYLETLREHAPPQQTTPEQLERLRQQEIKQQRVEEERRRFYAQIPQTSDPAPKSPVKRESDSPYGQQYGRMRKITGSKPFLGASMAGVYAQNLGMTGVGGALLQGGTRSVTSAQRMAKAQDRRRYQDELGSIGRVDQLGRSISGIGRMTYSANLLAAMGAMGAGSLGIGGLSDKVGPTGSLIGRTSAALGGGLTGGLGTAAMLAPRMIGGIGAARKMSKIRPQKKQPEEASRKFSRAKSLDPFYRRLIADESISPFEQLQYLMLSYIEAHTSVLPSIHSMMEEKKEKEEKSAKGVDSLFKEKESESFFNKLEDGVNKIVGKYDPIAQMANLLFGGKTPKQFLDDIDKAKPEKVDEKEVRALGINRTQHRLITSSARLLTSGARSYEERMLALTIGQYDLARLMAQETITMRKHGFGVEHNRFMQPIDQKKSFMGQLDSLARSIPVIAAGYNFVKDLIQFPEKAAGFIKRSFSKGLDLVFGADFRRLQDKTEIDKELGFHKTTQEKANEYLAVGLPTQLEKMRVLSAQQLDAALNIFEVIRDQYELQHQYYTGEAITRDYEQKISEDVSRERIWDAIEARMLTAEGFEQALEKRQKQREFRREQAFLDSPLSMIGMFTKSPEERMEAIYDPLNRMIDTVRGMYGYHEKTAPVFRVGERGRKFETDEEIKRSLLTDKGVEGFSKDAAYRERFGMGETLAGMGTSAATMASVPLTLAAGPLGLLPAALSPLLNIGMGYRKDAQVQQKAVDELGETSVFGRNIKDIIDEVERFSKLREPEEREERPTFQIRDKFGELQEILEDDLDDIYEEIKKLSDKFSDDFEEKLFQKLDELINVIPPSPSNIFTSSDYTPSDAVKPFKLKPIKNIAKLPDLSDAAYYGKTMASSCLTKGGKIDTMTLVGEGKGPKISDTAEMIIGNRVVSTEQTQKFLKELGIETIDEFKKLGKTKYEGDLKYEPTDPTSPEFVEIQKAKSRIYAEILLSKLKKPLIDPLSSVFSKFKERRKRRGQEEFGFEKSAVEQVKSDPYFWEEDGQFCTKDDSGRPVSVTSPATGITDTLEEQQKEREQQKETAVQKQQKGYLRKIWEWYKDDDPEKKKKDKDSFLSKITSNLPMILKGLAGVGIAGLLIGSEGVKNVTGSLMDIVGGIISERPMLGLAGLAAAGAMAGLPFGIYGGIIGALLGGGFGLFSVLMAGADNENIDRRKFFGDLGKVFQEGMGKTFARGSLAMAGVMAGAPFAPPFGAIIGGLIGYGLGVLAPRVLKALGDSFEDGEFDAFRFARSLLKTPGEGAVRVGERLSKIDELVEKGEYQKAYEETQQLKEDRRAETSSWAQETLGRDLRRIRLMGEQVQEGAKEVGVNLKPTDLDEERKQEQEKWENIRKRQDRAAEIRKELSEEGIIRRGSGPIEYLRGFQLQDMDRLLEQDFSLEDLKALRDSGSIHQDFKSDLDELIKTMKEDSSDHALKEFADEKRDPKDTFLKRFFGTTSDEIKKQIEDEYGAYKDIGPGMGVGASIDYHQKIQEEYQRRLKEKLDKYGLSDFSDIYNMEGPEVTPIMPESEPVDRSILDKAKETKEDTPWYRRTQTQLDEFLNENINDIKKLPPHLIRELRDEYDWSQDSLDKLNKVLYNVRKERGYNISLELEQLVKEGKERQEEKDSPGLWERTRGFFSRDKEVEGKSKGGMISNVALVGEGKSGPISPTAEFVLTNSNGKSTVVSQDESQKVIRKHGITRDDLATHSEGGELKAGDVERIIGLYRGGKLDALCEGGEIKKLSEGGKLEKITSCADGGILREVENLSKDFDLDKIKTYSDGGSLRDIKGLVEGGELTPAEEPVQALWDAAIKEWRERQTEEKPKVTDLNLRKTPYTEDDYYTKSEILDHDEQAIHDIEKMKDASLSKKPDLSPGKIAHTEDDYYTKSEILDHDEQAARDIEKMKDAKPEVIDKSLKFRPLTEKDFPEEDYEQDRSWFRDIYKNLISRAFELITSIFDLEYERPIDFISRRGIPLTRDKADKYRELQRDFVSEGHPQSEASKLAMDQIVEENPKYIEEFSKLLEKVMKRLPVRDLDDPIFADKAEKIDEFVAYRDAMEMFVRQKDLNQRRTIDDIVPDPKSFERWKEFLTHEGGIFYNQHKTVNMDYNSRLLAKLAKEEMNARKYMAEIPQINENTYNQILERHDSEWKRKGKELPERKQPEHFADKTLGDIFGTTLEDIKLKHNYPLMDEKIDQFNKLYEQYLTQDTPNLPEVEAVNRLREEDPDYFNLYDKIFKNEIEKIGQMPTADVFHRAQRNAIERFIFRQNLSKLLDKFDFDEDSSVPYDSVVKQLTDFQNLEKLDELFLIKQKFGEDLRKTAKFDSPVLKLDDDLFTSSSGYRNIFKSFMLTLSKNLDKVSDMTLSELDYLQNRMFGDLNIFEDDKLNKLTRKTLNAFDVLKSADDVDTEFGIKKYDLFNITKLDKKGAEKVKDLTLSKKPDEEDPEYMKKREKVEEGLPAFRDMMRGYSEGGSLVEEIGSGIVKQVDSLMKGMFSTDDVHAAAMPAGGMSDDMMSIFKSHESSDDVIKAFKDGRTVDEIGDYDSSPVTRSNIVDADDEKLNELLRKHIIFHEGIALRKYQCSEGHPTIGVGHKLGPDSDIPSRIDKGYAMELFNKDFAKHYQLASRIPEFNKLGPVRQRALVDMVYNMGLSGVMGFENMREALAEGDYERAYNEALDSDWAGQVGNRAQRVAKLLKTGDPGYFSTDRPQVIARQGAYYTGEGTAPLKAELHPGEMVINDRQFDTFLKNMADSISDHVRSLGSTSDVKAKTAVSQEREIQQVDDNRRLDEYREQLERERQREEKREEIAETPRSNMILNQNVQQSDYGAANQGKPDEPTFTSTDTSFDNLVMQLFNKTDILPHKIEKFVFETPHLFEYY